MMLLPFQVKYLIVLVPAMQTFDLEINDLQLTYGVELRLKPGILALKIRL